MRQAICTSTTRPTSSAVSRTFDVLGQSSSVFGYLPAYSTGASPRQNQRGFPPPTLPCGWESGTGPTKDCADGPGWLDGMALKARALEPHLFGYASMLFRHLSSHTGRTPRPVFQDGTGWPPWTQSKSICTGPNAQGFPRRGSPRSDNGVPVASARTSGARPLPAPQPTVWCRDRSPPAENTEPLMELEAVQGHRQPRAFMGPRSPEPTLAGHAS